VPDTTVGCWLLKTAVAGSRLVASRVPLSIS